MRALTVKQPHASLIVAGIKPVENRSWPVPSTLPQWGRCSGCHNRVPPTSRIATDHQPIHRPGEHPEACGPIEWDDGPFPFILAIHAAKADTDNDPTIPKMAWDALGEVIGGAAPPRGVLLGYVTVTGCHKALSRRLIGSLRSVGRSSGRPGGWVCSWGSSSRWPRELRGKLAERIGQPVVLRYEPRRGRHREEQGFPTFGKGQWSVAIDRPTTRSAWDSVRKMHGLGAGYSRREAMDNAERAVEAMLADQALRQRQEHDEAEAGR